jgi:hypothetical protein
MQVLVRLAFRTDFTLQHGVGAFGGYLTPRFVPKFVGAVIGAPILLPEQIGSIANDLVQDRLGFLANWTEGKSIRVQRLRFLPLDVE